MVSQPIAWKVGRIHLQHVPLVAGISNQERCHTKPITDITAHFRYPLVTSSITPWLSSLIL